MVVMVMVMVMTMAMTINRTMTPQNNFSVLGSPMVSARIEQHSQAGRGAGQAFAASVGLTTKSLVYIPEPLAVLMCQIRPERVTPSAVLSLPCTLDWYWNAS